MNDTKDLNQPVPDDIFLIIEGVRNIPITQEVTSIGRGSANVIVLDDPRVSRRHLEIRFIRDNFILFDLDSSGGTFVNGQRVNQGMLYSGDLISLAGVNIVFMKGSTLPHRGNENPTGERKDPDEHTTVVFRKSAKNG